MKMMITRRNWLLRCSILANIAVLLYICSHVMIGGSNFAVPPSASYLVQQQSPPAPSSALDELAKRADLLARIKDQVAVVAEVAPPEREAAPEAERVEAMREFSPKQVGEQAAAGAPDGGGQQPVVVVETNEAVDDSRFEVPTDETRDKKDDLVEAEGNTANFAGSEMEAKLKTILKCHDRDYEPFIEQRGDFWVLKNYVRAEHGELRCWESITYTTHADYSFLDNLPPLLERWNAPISIALHAPGTDFQPTINSIKYLRDCVPESQLVRQFVTFHIYFSSKHVPKSVPKYDKVLTPVFNCSLLPPYHNVSASQLYKTQKKLLYPVNVGRNIARDAALTHFILASDIELYPNPAGLVQKFLEMIARNDAPLRRKAPKVFPLSLFEVDASVSVPRDKTELQELLKSGKAIPFHKRVCAACHGVPKSKEWMAANETENLGIFHIGKRLGYFVHWEPIYIGTNADPHYDERLSWEGKSDKMTQKWMKDLDVPHVDEK